MKIKHLISRIIENITVSTVLFMQAVFFTVVPSLCQASSFDLTLSYSVVVFMGIVALFQSDVPLYLSATARTLMELFDE